MTDSTAGHVIPGLIPTPQEVSLPGGELELSEDIRLVTSNVFPMQRKAMRGILTSAGVRVVANKKRYVVEVKVLPPEELDLAEVPEATREEYYEIELIDTVVNIRSAGQAGALWGVQTLAGIYACRRRGNALPNMVIRDWPLLPNRGIFVESKWGPDRMGQPDWCQVIDRVAALKMNRLGIGLYGCWGKCRFEGPASPTEFLMVPMTDGEEEDEDKQEEGPVTRKHLRWYSPLEETWQEDTYVPAMAADDCLGDVVTYAQERGVAVIPFVNSFGHNTFFPRIMPEVSAKDENGEPLGIGYDIRGAETRAFLESFYGRIIERYYPNGCDYFHIQMDEVWPDFPDPEDPCRRADPWGAIPEAERPAALRDYVIWLVGMLVDKGVGKVVMWNDQLTRHMDVLDETFATALDDAGLADRIVLHWWWYNNDGLHEKTHVSLGLEHGIPGWVAPMTCYFNWQRYDWRRDNIAAMLQMAYDEGAEGAVSYSVHDPDHHDHEALLAGCAWSGMGDGDPDTHLREWAAQFGPDGAERCVAALGALKQAAASPALGRCYHYTYTYVQADRPFPRPYPEEALQALEHMDGAANCLKAAGDEATVARQAFAELAALESLGDTAMCTIRGLMAEAARIQALVTAFTVMLQIRDGEDADAEEQMGEARDGLLAAMQLIESHKPDWVAPACLQGLSALFEVVEQLIGDIQAGDELRWTLADG